VKLANADVVFYIIDGFYATIITRSSGYTYGDAATFTGLTQDPALSCISRPSLGRETTTTASDSEAVVTSEAFLGISIGDSLKYTSELSLSAQLVASITAHSLALIALIANI